MRVDSLFAGGVQAGSGAWGTSGAGGASDAGAFDGLLGALLSPLPVAGDSSVGAPAGEVPGRLDESLPIGRLLPCDAREATDTGTAAVAWPAGLLQAEAAPVSAAAPPDAPVSAAAPADAPVFAAAPPAAPVSAAAPADAPVSAAAPADARGTGTSATEASGKEDPGVAQAVAYQFLASLPGMPYAQQDLQPGMRPGQALAAGEALAGDAGAGVLSRSAESLMVGRTLPSNPQQGIEPAGASADVPLAPAEAPPAGAGLAEAPPAVAGSAEAPPDHFVDSPPDVPFAEHDLQRAIESGQGVAAGELLAGDPGAAATPGVDDSLPARRLLPFNPQQSIESGYPATAKESLPVMPGAISTADVDDSLHARQLLTSGARVSVEAGKAGTTGTPVLGKASAVPGGAQGRAFPQESTPVGMGSGSPLAGYAPAATDGIAAEATEPESKAHNGVPVFVAQHTRQPGIEPADAASTHPAPGVPQPAPPGVPAPTQPAPAVVLHAQPHPGMQPQPPAQQQPTPQQPLAHQLAQPLFTLASARPGEHVMTVQVSPEDLGPLTVRAHIDGAGVRIELFASGEAGREAVRHALPELRRGLEDAGASLSLSSHNNPQDAPKDSGAGSRHHGQTGYQGPVRSGPTEAPETAPSRKQSQSPNQLDILV